MLKNDTNIVKEKTYIWKFDCSTSLILLTVKKPPDETIVNERLNASNVLKLIIL